MDGELQVEERAVVFVIFVFFIVGVGLREVADGGGDNGGAGGAGRAGSVAAADEASPSPVPEEAESFHGGESQNTQTVDVDEKGQVR